MTPASPWMTFLWPSMLWAMLALPLIVALYVLLLKRRKKTNLRYANLALVKEALGSRSAWRRHVPPALLFVALAVLTFSTSRPAMLITLPFVLPVIVKLGYDAVWWGIINVVVIELGMIIPPIGVIVFLLHGLAREIPMRTIYRGVTPFIVADLVLLTVLTVFPAIALWLPRLLAS